MRKAIGVAVIISLLVGLSVYAYKWVKHRREYAVTNAVFVRADELSYVGFRLPGRVIEVRKFMGDFVKKGELLARIDPTYILLELESVREKRRALKEQKSALERKLKRMKGELLANLRSAELRVEEIKKEKKALKSEIKALRAKLYLLEKDTERFGALAERGLAPMRKYEQVKSERDALRWKIRALEDKLSRAEVSERRARELVKRAHSSLLALSELEHRIRSLSHEIESLRKREEVLLERLRDTELRAPFDGVVAKRFVSRGDTLRAGQPAFALVNPESFYIEVLLEETKLRGVKVGSVAYIRLDAYPDVVFEGVVEEISPATAATFALVPRDVSAGEFTKVVQRIPIKIRITKGDKSLLRVGMGGEVEIRRER